MSFAKLNNYSLIKLLFITKQDYIAASSITIKEVVNNKSDQCWAAFKKEIIKDIADVGHMMMSIMFDGGST